MHITQHARKRFLERDITERAVVAALAHGRECRGTRGERIFYLDALCAMSAAKAGADVWAHVEVAVVVVEDVVLTAFRIAEESARRRWR